MRIRRRWIIGSLVGLGALGATAVGVAVAAPSSQGESPRDRLIERAAAILGIETNRLETAIQQAQADLEKERRDEQIQKLVEEGILTQQEADDVKKWLDAMPDAARKVPFKHFLPGPIPPNHRDAFVVPRWGPLLGDIGGILDQLVADGVITQEKAEEIRDLLKEKAGELDLRHHEIKPFPRGNGFEHQFRFHGPAPHFGPRFPHELPFEKPTPESTPLPGT